MIMKKGEQTESVPNYSGWFNFRPPLVSEVKLLNIMKLNLIHMQEEVNSVGVKIKRQLFSQYSASLLESFWLIHLFSLSNSESSPKQDTVSLVLYNPLAVHTPSRLNLFYTDANYWLPSISFV